jgi:hypothetical protein
LAAGTQITRILEQEHAIQTALEAAIGLGGATMALTIRESGLNLPGEAGRLQPGTATQFAPAPTA